MKDCIFCKIVAGEIPSYMVWEDEGHLAFLTIAPFREGHTLVIPKKHTDYIFDLSPTELSGLMEASRKVAETLQRVFKPKTGKIGMVVAGDEVLHAHIHLIPFDKVSDLSFSSAHPATPQELNATLAKVRG